MAERRRIVEHTHGDPVRAPGAGMRVLVVSPDVRFREVVSLLLARRGCAVSVSETASMLGERVARVGAEVVVIDAARSLSAAARTAAAAEALSPPVGVVVVGNPSEGGLLELQILDRWGSFEAMFDAIEQAHGDRSSRPAGRSG